MLFDSLTPYRLPALLPSLFLGLTLTLGHTAQAADAEAQRWYDVEVIIFSQNSQQYRDSELWPVDYELPQLETTQELLPAPRAAQTTGSASVPFTRLDAQSLRLNAEAERIKSAPDTELLLHLGWRQPGLAEDKAVAVRIDDGMQAPTEPGQPPASPASTAGAGNAQLLEEAPPHRMEGTLKLVLSRYLHIYTDLIYREPLSESASEPAAAQTDLFALAADPLGLSLQPRYQVYHLQQSRRMRSRELHYLDHPLFGMAILVTPYELKEATGN